MIRIVRAGDDFARAGAEAIASVLEQRLQKRPRVSFAVSGGRTPAPVFEALADKALPWERIDIFQVDERVAPAGDEARNLRGLEASLLSRVAATGHAMPVEEPNLEEAARAYARGLPPSLDLVHLGLGADGHTASLVPGDPALDVLDAPLAITEPYQGHVRMTLTFPVIDAAAARVWLVTGADKRVRVQQLLAGDLSIPAGRVRQENTVLVADAAALR
ncbi:MAG: 6-phosphogluconolactonase [Myxococcota bacterium]